MTAEVKRVYAFGKDAEGNNVTEDFVKYAMPLIQGETKLEKVDGLPRFARLKKVFAK